MKILYDMETMKFSSLFETLTQTRLKDCFKDGEDIVFVVMPGYIAKAIGKKGVNVNKMRGIIKKNIRIIEFSSDVKEFVRKILPVKNVEVEQQESFIVIKCPDVRTKGQVFGREKENLKKMTSIVKRYFKIDEIKVE